MVHPVRKDQMYRPGKAYNIRCLDEEQNELKHLVLYTSFASNIGYRHTTLDTSI